MTEIDNLVLRFSGDKLGLKKQLKEWCEENGKTMNKTVIQLIQDLIASKEEETNPKI